MVIPQFLVLQEGHHFVFYSANQSPSCSEPVKKLYLLAFLIYLMTLALVTSACSLLIVHSDYRAIDMAPVSSKYRGFEHKLLIIWFWMAAKLYLPKVNRSSKAAVDMWIKVLPDTLPFSSSIFVTFFSGQGIGCKYIELLAKGTVKPKEELVKDIQRPKYLKAQEAIDYGIADILSSNDDAFLAQTKAMKVQAAGPRAAPLPLALDDDKI